ncbi:MAG: zinc-binding dehydrogenase [Firmicutes bacterium]|nr:zinc-binding dehydrogenase [Bacillota bacterium]
MKILRAKGNSAFEISENETLSNDPSLIKVKISFVCPTLSDLGLFNGKYNIEKPISPCHLATGVISEDREEFGLKRGTKVIINPYIQNQRMAFGQEPQIYGVNEDGFLRDFVALPIENIIPYPEGVKENEALYAEILAVGASLVKSLNLSKGEYVVVLGASVLTNLIAQLASYYHAIPIVISNNQKHNEIAKKCGIYYTIDESSEDVIQRVMNITGGRFADYTVLHTVSGVTPHFLFSLARRGGEARIVSLSDRLYKVIETNINLISKKQLTVKGISCGADEFDNAINLLTLKTLNFQYFIDEYVDFNNAQQLFENLSEDCHLFPVIKI